MNSNAYTATMQGLGGESSQYLFITFGLGSSTVEPTTGDGRFGARHSGWMVIHFGGASGF